jgi:iron(III) transport system substrate-binding protein
MRPETASAIVEGAAVEGKVVVYSTTDTRAVSALLASFEQRFPAVHIDYREMGSTDVYERFLADAAAGEGSADVLWSSAMDLQIKLANDGYAAEYDSPAVPSLPAWAVWKNEAFGTTFEPIGFAYNKRLLDADSVPRSHADVVRLVNAAPERWRGKICMYDPERSGIGFLLLSQDAKTDPAFADTLKAYGSAEVKLYPTTGAMLDKVASGEQLVGLNVIGSYVLAKAREDPSIGLVLPKDYTLVMSRIALIPKVARHPNAARLFLDFVLSVPGQEIIAAEARLFAIRNGVRGEATGRHLWGESGDRLRPVTIGPSLLVYLDQAKRLEFLRRWRQVLQQRTTR